MWEFLYFNPMLLKTYCYDDREATFVRNDYDRLTKRNTIIYFVEGLGEVAFYSEPINNRYYNVGNTAYWLENN